MIEPVAAARAAPRASPPATWQARGAAQPEHHGRGRGPGCGYHSDAPGVGPTSPLARATVQLYTRAQGGPLARCSAGVNLL